MLEKSDRPVFGIIDLFAGPGGLAEGFAECQVDGRKPFRILLSVEKDAAAHRTLLLRTFLRQFPKGPPQAYYDALNEGRADVNWAARYPNEWAVAEGHALHLTLGEDDARTRIEARIRSMQREFRHRLIVIGGPPCQAYSLVGRSRNKGNAGYVPSSDHRHFLYREYIEILRQVRPVAFVMENVRGLTSSRVDGERIFPRVIRDLQGAAGPDSYSLIKLTGGERGRPSMGPEPRESEDFLVRTEDYGVPQARHRVIIVGVRADIASRLRRHLNPPQLTRQARVPAAAVLSGLPPLRSGVRGDAEDRALWLQVTGSGYTSLMRDPDVASDIKQSLRRSMEHSAVVRQLLNRQSTGRAKITGGPEALQCWIRRRQLEVALNHETRIHMPEDLHRYLFAAAFAVARGRSPKAADFPRSLAPRHRNWATGVFDDRFRVQLLDRPSSTVTSHLAKDGHYFIHPDPAQCRSLTVREAARLQTFPDDYWFMGSRTEQFTQVGNAVPPYLARQIATVLAQTLQAAGAHL